MIGRAARSPLLTAVTLVLGLLGGWLLLRRSPPSPVPAAITPGGAGNSPTLPSNATVATSAAPASGSDPLAPALLATTAPRQVELPPVPSGDYEVDLKPAQVAAIVDVRYAGFLASLSLPAERRARLRALLIERQQAAIDAANAALLIGLNPERDLATIREGIVEAQDGVDAMVRQEFGAAVLAARHTFDETAAARNSAAEFAQTLAVSSEPLRPEQQLALARLLHAPAPASPASFDLALFGPVNARAAIAPQTLAAAAAVLSPRQLESLRQFQQRGSASAPR